LQTLRLELVNLLIAVARDPAIASEQPTVFLGAVNQAAFTYTPTLTSHTFENLRSTGDLRLVRDESVKSVMFDYYGFDEEERQFRPLQLATEARHFELAAGVLSNEQEVFMQDAWLFFRPHNFDAAKSAKTDDAGVAEAAMRLQGRPQLVAWLPYVRSLQLDQLEAHNSRLGRAHKALEALSNYAREIQAPAAGVSN
jgi:hypothetical protein